MNKFPERGWSAKLMHYTGFMACMPHIGGDDIPEKHLIALADLIIFQRNIISEEAIKAIKYWHALGKPVAIDLDDAYQILPPSNPAWDFWIKGRDQFANVEAWDQLEKEGELPPSVALNFLAEGLRQSAGLISPNRRLLKSWSHCIGDKQYYLQNYAEKAWWENLPDRESLKAKMGLTGKIVIGWGGSISHLDSFAGSGVIDALERVLRHRPNVVLKFCGNDNRVPNFLDGIAAEQIVRQPGVPPEEWPKQVKSFDIGIAPLFDGFPHYDQNRSWIKGIEYLLAGVPWIGTHPGDENGTYADLNGLGYLIHNSVREWELTLIRIIDNLAAEQERAESLIPMAQQRFIVDYNLDVFAKVYRKIIEDFRRDGGGGNGQLPEVIHT